MEVTSNYRQRVFTRRSLAGFQEDGVKGLNRVGIAACIWLGRSYHVYPTCVFVRERVRLGFGLSSSEASLSEA